MIKNIYKELVLIREELQAIRKCQESQESVYMVREPYSTNYRLVRAGRNYQAGIWRRFELLTDDIKEIKELESLCEAKGLTRADLARILFSLRVRPGFRKSDFGI